MLIKGIEINGDLKSPNAVVPRNMYASGRVYTDAQAFDYGLNIAIQQIKDTGKVDVVGNTKKNIDALASNVPGYNNVKQGVDEVQKNITNITDSLGGIKGTVAIVAVGVVLVGVISFFRK